MKKVMIAMVALIVTASFAGCAGRTVHLKNSRGVKITCKVSTLSAMFTGVLIRDNSIDECIKEKKAAGFRVTKEE